MNDQPDRKKKSLWYAIIDGCATSVMAGFGDTYFSPFAIFLKASNTAIGFLSSMPQLIGTGAQFISVSLLDRIGKRKSLIIGAMTAQFFLWILIFSLPFIWRDSGPTLLIAVIVIYTAAANFTSPAWSSLMGDLVEPGKRGNYFGKRTRIMSVFSFTSVLCAGFILHYWKPINEWLGFGIIFGVAFMARGVSIYYINQMMEPGYIVRPQDHFTLWDFIKRSPKSNFARFVFYIGLMNLAAQIISPFVPVYILRELKFTYAQFTLTSLTLIIAQFLTMRYWGKLCDRFGSKKILSITAWLVSFVPILWLLSSNFYWILLIVQIFTGFAWGGFSLSSSNFIFDAVSPPKRARCVAYYSLFANVGLFIGATFGGWISHYLPRELILYGWQITFASSLLWLFLISGLLRLLITAIFLTHIREVRTVEAIPTWELIYQISHVKPIIGPILDIFTGVNREEEI